MSETLAAPPEEPPSFLQVSRPNTVPTPPLRPPVVCGTRAAEPEPAAPSIPETGRAAPRKGGGAMRVFLCNPRPSRRIKRRTVASQIDTEHIKPMGQVAQKGSHFPGCCKKKSVLQEKKCSRDIILLSLIVNFWLFLPKSFLPPFNLVKLRFSDGVQGWDVRHAPVKHEINTWCSLQRVRGLLPHLFITRLQAER